MEFKIMQGRSTIGPGEHGVIESSLRFSRLCIYHVCVDASSWKIFSKLVYFLFPLAKASVLRLICSRHHG